ncbi:MBL fold metallo-hydrolase [Streptomyces sp. NPDC060194]|uniref:MBL fold metallo-hydrolase n=1 Tax=Streptomyces sp. NPDC060194 TaxID=3347069 RepID=UPI00366424FD
MTGPAPLHPLRTRLRTLRTPPFGADATGERWERIRNSPNFADGVFRNPGGPSATRPSGSARSFAKVYFDKELRALRAPAGRVPVYPTTLAELSRPAATGLRLTWMGHSSVLAEIGGRRVLFDPVWGERCSPFSFAGPRRVHPVPVPLTALGPVDVVVISHDHYDHLDLPTIRGLARTDTVFAVPLGIGAHLEHWGVPAARIRELDWHDSTEVGGLRLTATPARHFCGRGLRNQQHTLWASWVVAGGGHRIFHSGDTGYFPGFADIGAEHGPFDATMIQLGAYSAYWPQGHTDPVPDPGAWPDIHMTPAEAVRAHLDLQGGTPGGVLLPIHWGTFNLAFHAWGEPAEWTVDVAGEAGQSLALPRPGEPFEPGGQLPAEPWWRPVAGRLAHPWRGDGTSPGITPSAGEAGVGQAVEH